ncbi:MAG TPA: hypothetical protein VFC69_03510 [Dysgonamonadaceae bacterium]|nr:hypothetical protein [Dysgonamonadaceae bacterium]
MFDFHCYYDGHFDFAHHPPPITHHPSLITHHSSLISSSITPHLFPI